MKIIFENVESVRVPASIVKTAIIGQLTEEPAEELSDLKYSEYFRISFSKDLFNPRYLNVTNMHHYNTEESPDMYTIIKSLREHFYVAKDITSIEIIMTDDSVLWLAPPWNEENMMTNSFMSFEETAEGYYLLIEEPKNNPSFTWVQENKEGSSQKTTNV